MRVIIIEDDKLISQGILEGVSRMGHAVDCAYDVTQAEAAISCTQYDLILLDLGLPRIPGINLLEALRNKGDSTPVIILTASNELEIRVKALNAGADDYLIKPFSITELEARIRAVTRRRFQNTPQLKIGNLTYDQNSRRVYVGEDEINLSAREQAILEFLLLNGERLVSKEQLLEQICSWDHEVSINAIEVYIHRLRRKLEKADLHINTSRGMGYNIRMGSTLRS